ncbi:hypothetical protein [Sphingobacterium sp. 2149]|uniref:hypothetical protein n=1 Tax=Sphingobacterium sp. 2149 TaxID=2817763 RepID=UPI0028635B02|nr:hypothetical protein [Sphingobacterium sp. 2149]MDR6735493.1 hypothetical protein [Sphingobacterium sp. 2149]
MKITGRLIIIAFTIIACVLCYINFKKNDIATLVAAISTIVALASFWIAFEVFQRQEALNNPQLVIDFDVKSRPRILQLILSNYGNSPAFNVSIDWDIILIQRDDSPFNVLTGQQNQIPVLNKNQTLNFFIDSTVDFYAKKRDLTYSGIINYSLDRNGKYYRKEKFTISLIGYKKTMLYQTELSETLKQLRKIPDALNEIRTEIQNKNT